MYPLVVDLKPIQNLVAIKYNIGSQPVVVNLMQYYNVNLTSEVEIKFYATQTSGLPIKNFKIDPQNKFSLKVDDESFFKTKAYFEMGVTTNLTDQIPNNDLVIEIEFKKNATNSSD